MIIFALSGSKSVAKVITILLEMARAKGFAKVIVDALPRISDALRANLADKVISINTINYKSLHDRIQKFQSTIFISQTSYDPLFGFSGTPTLLLRNFMDEQMFEAFKSRQGNLPKPGVKGLPLKIAFSASEHIPATSIELVANTFGIAGIYYGNIIEASNNAIRKLSLVSTIEVQLAKSAIISTSNEIDPHLTLVRSLNSLWNSIHSVRENGSAVLLAENREGVGGGALQMFVEGRLTMEQLHHESFYINGLEHLLYLEELRHKYQLGIVSTLPQYYLKTILGFTSYMSMKDVMQKLLIKYGKNHKVLVLSDSDIIFLKPTF
jgi:hypothetical protein